MRDWVDGLIGAKSPIDATRAFLSEVNNLDAVNVSYRVLIGEHDVAGFTTSPEDWRRRYFEQGYEAICPSVKGVSSPAKRLMTSFDHRYPGYNASGRVAQLFDEAYDASGSGAFCVYFKSRWGTNIVTVFTGTPGQQFDSWSATYGSRLALMMAAFNEKMLQLQGGVGAFGADPSLLTTRELDCVAWLATGLRVSAIAHKLGVSERTVEFHLANARRKLDAPTRESLVAKVLMAPDRTSDGRESGLLF